jgi:hypothetical protein
MDFRHEILEIRENMFRRFLLVQIVAARPQKDHARFVGEDDSVGEVGGIHDLRPAEAAVEDALTGKIRGKRVPQTDRRGADKKEAAFGRRLGSVFLFVGCYSRLR